MLPKNLRPKSAEIVNILCFSSSDYDTCPGASAQGFSVAPPNLPPTPFPLSRLLMEPLVGGSENKIGDGWSTGKNWQQ